MPYFKPTETWNDATLPIEKHGLQPMFQEGSAPQTGVEEGGLQDTFPNNVTPAEPETIPRVKLKNDWNKPEAKTPSKYNPYGDKGLTGRQLIGIRESFLGDDPLSCIEYAAGREQIENILSRFDVDARDRIKKAVALAHYYSMGHREMTGFIFDNLDAAIEEFEGKKMSVEQAFESVKQIYMPPDEGLLAKTFENRAVAAATSSVLNITKSTMNTATFATGKALQVARGADWVLLNFLGALAHISGFEETGKFLNEASNNLPDWGGDFEDSFQEAMKNSLGTVLEWEQQNMRVPGDWVTNSDSLGDWFVNAGLSLLNYAPELAMQIGLSVATGGTYALATVYGINGYYDIKGDIPDVNEGEALLYGIGIGAINGALEKVSLGIVEGKVAEKFVQHGIKKGVTNILAYIGANQLMEGSEEAIEEFAENLLDISMGRRGETKDWTCKQWFKNLTQGIPEAFFLGFMTGGFMGVPHIGDLRERAEINEAQRRGLERRKEELDAKDELTDNEKTEYSAVTAALDSNDPEQVRKAAVGVVLNNSLRAAQERQDARARVAEAELRVEEAQRELDEVSARPTQDPGSRFTAVAKYREAKANLDAARAELSESRKELVKVAPEEETEEEETARKEKEWAERDEKNAKNGKNNWDFRHRIPWDWRNTRDSAEEIVQKYFPGFRVVTVRTADELPDAAKTEAARRTDDSGKGIDLNKIRGFTSMDGNTVYIIANRVPPSEVGKLIGHEIIGHHGLRAAFGEKYDAFLDEVYRDHKEDIDKLASAYNTRTDNDAGRRYLTEDFLANLADAEKKPSWWKEFIGKIRAFLREYFPGMRISDADIEAALSRGARAARKMRDSSGAPDGRFALVGVRGAFSGQNDKAAFDNFIRANKMEQEGLDAKSIWLGTGWERGADGNWRMEMPDVKIKIGELTAGGNYDALPMFNGKLSDFADAPELFKAYPDLKDIKVVMTPLRPDTRGYYDHANKTIALSRAWLYSDHYDAINDMEADRKDAKTPEEARQIEANIKDFLETIKEGLENTLIHEVQHAIQHIEGFVAGTNLDAVLYVLNDEDPAFMRKKEEFQKNWKKLEDVAEKTRRGDSLLSTVDVWLERDIYKTSQSFYNAISSVFLRQVPEDTPDRLKLFNEFVPLATDLFNIDEAMKALSDKYSRYKRYAGEVEARNATDRAAMSSESRMLRPPSETEDVPREDQIVRFSVTDSEAFQNWFKDSKVVDENGDPLVVYHGTDADFNIFDMDKTRANMDIRGAFFSPWDDDARGYGKNVRAFYLSIQNPASGDEAYKALNKFKGQNNAGVKARNYLIQQGYDGVINENEEYIAFYPEQIKSATDNIGTFDPNNPDVRFSVSPVWTGSAADYEQADIHYIGTGEGNQVYGWGLYGSSSQDVAEGYAQLDVYRKTIIPNDVTYRGKKIPLYGGRHEAIKSIGLDKAEELALGETLFYLIDTHDVEEAIKYARPSILKDFRLIRENEEAIKTLDDAFENVRKNLEYKKRVGKRNVYKQTFWPDKEENLLDWNKRVSEEQIKQIDNALSREGDEPLFYSYANGLPTGKKVYTRLVHLKGSPKAASEFLYGAGIDGVTYIGDRALSGNPKGVRDYVAFSDTDIRTDEHIRFSIENYSEDDQRDITAFLKPKYRTASFVEPAQVKQYLSDNGFGDIDENDAWSFYQRAGMEIKDEQKKFRTEQKKRRDKERDDWIYKNNLLYHDMVDYAGTADFKIIPSFRFDNGDEWPGTFIAENWRKHGSLRKQGKRENDMRYREYLRKREESLRSLKNGITSDDFARYIARIRGLDELDVEQDIIDTFRNMTKPKLWEQYYQFKKDENWRNVKEEREAREAFEADMRAAIEDEAVEIIMRGNPITEEWAVENKAVFDEVFKLLFNEEAPKSAKPSKTTLEAINEALKQKEGDASQYARAYKEARESSWEEYRRKLSDIRKQMNQDKVDAAQLQRKAAEFAENNLPEELRGKFTRGIIKLLDYSISPSKVYPEGRRLHEFRKLLDSITSASKEHHVTDNISEMKEMADAVKTKRNWKGIPVSVIPSEAARVERIRKILDMTPASVAAATDYNNERILELEAEAEAEHNRLLSSEEGTEFKSVETLKQKYVEDNMLLEMYGNLAYKSLNDVRAARGMLKNLIEGGKAKFAELLGERAAEANRMRSQAEDEITFGRRSNPYSEDARKHWNYTLKNMSLGSLLRLVSGQSITDFDNSIPGELWRKIEDSTQAEMTDLRRLQEDFDAALEKYAGVTGTRVEKMQKKGRFLKDCSRVVEHTGVFKTEYSREHWFDNENPSFIQEGRSGQNIDLIPVEDYDYMGAKKPGARSILQEIDAANTAKGSKFDLSDEAKAVAIKYELDEVGVWFLRKQIDDYDAGIKRSYDLFVNEIDEAARQKLEEDFTKDSVTLIRRGKNTTMKRVEVPMSQGTALQILFTWEQEDYRANMKWNGWTEESIEQIKKFLKPETLELGKWMKQQFETRRGSLDKAVAERYGAHLPVNDNYWPGRFAGMQAKEGSGQRGAGTMNINPNFLIARKFHLKPMDMDADAFSVFFGGQIEQSHFLAWTDTIRQLREVYGNKNIQEAIDANFGHDVTRNLVERIATIARGGNSGEHISKLLSGFYRYWIPAKIALNASSIIKQRLSEVAYMNNMPVKDFVKYRMRANFTNPEYRAFVEWALKTDYMKNRLAGGIDKDIIYMMQNTRDNAQYSPFADSLMSAATYLTKHADKMSALHGGFAIYQYTLDEARKSGLSEKDAQERASRMWMRSTDETQQSGYLKDQNYYQQNQGWVRYMTAFLSNPIQVMNLELRTMNELRYGKGDKSETTNKLARQILVNHLIVPTLMQFTTEMVRAGFSAPEWWDEAEFEDYIIAWLFGPFEGMFILGKAGIEALNVLGNELPGRKRWRGQQGGAIRLIDDALEDAQRAMKDLKDGDITANDVMDGLSLAGDIGMLYGATPGLGAVESGSIGAFANASAKLGKRIVKILGFGDDDEKNPGKSTRRKNSASKRRK